MQLKRLALHIHLNDSTVNVLKFGALVQLPAKKVKTNMADSDQTASEEAV